ncbi:hypothetical protein F4802DRAFT_601591 [Xylaria palmicola]|nr:hypothetical protein F4802DRAFT_601591 [Xylaria palmicola]
MEPPTRLDNVPRAQINSIRREIQAIYDAGTPVFTKDSIRKVGHELERFQKEGRKDGETIVLRGINGVDYEVLVDPPLSEIIEACENDHVGGSTWIIRYNSIVSLTRNVELEHLRLQKAYLPMWICAPIRRIGEFAEFKDPPNPPEEDFNIYQAIEKQWKASEHFGQVQEMLASVEIPFTVTKVISLALGPLVLKSRVVERCTSQHALASVLRQRFSISLNPIVQDPIYTQRDKNILYSAGFTVLEDPQALLELDEFSILLAISPDLPVKDIVADICRPGIIIWNREAPHIRSLW